MHILGILGKTQGNVLLWRGVLRIANEDLQERIKPSQLKWPKRVLVPRDKQEIEKLEKESSCDAVEKLIVKLLELEKPDWPELFLKSLRPHFPKVAEAMSCLAEKLKNNIFADATLEVDDNCDEQGKV